MVTGSLGIQQHGGDACLLEPGDGLIKGAEIVAIPISLCFCVGLASCELQSV